MIIGRTLSKVFSTLEQMCDGKTLGKEIFRELDYISLPLASMAYWNKYDEKNDEINEETGEIERKIIRTVIPTLGWDKFQTSSYKDIKRDLSKAFDRRRSVKVGETFEFEGGYAPAKWGELRQHVTVKRISDKAVVVDTKNHPLLSGSRYLVSSSKEDLIKYEHEGGEPVLYKGVIF